MPRPSTRFDVHITYLVAGKPQSHHFHAVGKDRAEAAGKIQQSLNKLEATFRLAPCTGKSRPGEPFVCLGVTGYAT